MTARLSLRRRVPKGTPEGWSETVHPVLRQIYASRGVLTPADADHRLARMLAPHQLGGMERAVELLA